jgi:hypothetical protein
MCEHGKGHRSAGYVPEDSLRHYPRRHRHGRSVQSVSIEGTMVARYVPREPLHRRRSALHLEDP